jgi:dienelactone hydrolase
LSNHAISSRDGRARGTKHGFALDDRPAYGRRADERHWAALLDLFARNLK